MGLSFPLNPAGYRYRGLKVQDPILSGWDVAALQTGLKGLKFDPGPVDGRLGPKTEAAAKKFQTARKLTADGIAGVVTQREVALQTLWPLQEEHGLPSGLARGQIEAESSFWLGNHSPKYVENGSYDIGVVQRNDRYASHAQGFDVPASLGMFAGHLKAKHDVYLGKSGAKTERRAWELAAGSWNAPSWTDRLAGGGTLSPSQKAHIDSYIARVTVYYEEGG